MKTAPSPGAAVIPLALYRQFQARREDCAARHLGRAERLGYRLDAGQKTRLGRARRRRFNTLHESGRIDRGDELRGAPPEYFPRNELQGSGLIADYLDRIDLDLGPDGDEQP